MKRTVFGFALLVAGCAGGPSGHEEYERNIKIAAQVGVAESLCKFKFERRDDFYLSQAVKALPEKREIAKTEMLYDRLALVGFISPGAGVLNFCRGMMKYP